MKKFRIVNLIALSILVLVLLIVPTISYLDLNKDLKIDNAFVGDASEFRGVLECWNIDSFEGGVVSKNDFIEKVARLFEQKHKGLYVLVKKVTIEEFNRSVEKNNFPDVICFGQGLGNIVYSILEELNINKFEIKKELLNCGVVNGLLYAVPICLGSYVLISTSEKLENAGKQLNNKNLKDILLDCSYIKKGYKKEVLIYSYNYGKNEFLNPLLAVSNLKNDKVFESSSYYDAYNDFINFNRSTILLGNHRDVVKIENKEKNGKLSGVIIEPISTYNDLIHYAGVVKNDDGLRKKYAEYFVDYLASKTAQEKLDGSGLFSVCGLDLYKEGYLELLENAVNDCEKFSLAF